MLENDLQDKVNKILELNDGYQERANGVAIISRITNIKNYADVTSSHYLSTYEPRRVENKNKNPVNKYRFKYNESVSDILNTLQSETLSNINNGATQNISKLKNMSRQPDFLLSDGCSKFLILELKINKKTEREAITELFAYAQAIKENLPFLSDKNIKMIIIANDYNTLLLSATKNLLSSTNYSIMCLKYIETINDINFEIINPIYDHQEKTQNIEYKSFSTKNFSLSTLNELISDPHINYYYFILLNDILKSISSLGEKLNCNGFVEVYSVGNKLSNNSREKYFDIYISIINPLKMREYNINDTNNMFTNLCNLQSPIPEHILSTQQVFDAKPKSRNTFSILEPEYFSDEASYYIQSQLDDMLSIIYKLGANHFYIEHGSCLPYDEFRFFNESKLILADSWGFIKDMHQEELSKCKSLSDYNNKKGISEFKTFLNRTLNK